MKRRPGILAREAVGLLLAVILCFACLSFASAEERGTAARTILLYDCGSNLETDYGMATWNLYQILEAEIPEGINVVVLTGGSEKWQTEPEYLEGAEGVCQGGKNEIWVCSGRNAANAENGHGKMSLLTDAPEEIGAAYLSDGETLRAFIDYAAEKFPAERCDLILWDHGGGPQYGFGIDEHDPEKSIMSVGAVARALKESRVERFDIVDFDACLMSSVEVAASLSEYADYLVLSAETEPGYGQEYTTWLNALAADPEMNGFALGRIMVDAFVAFYEDPESPGFGQTGTLAVIDTKNFRERMMPEITELARIMDSELTTVGENNLLLNFQDEYRSQAAAYAFADEDLLDIGSFAEHLGICMSEISNAGEVDISILPNAYTETAEAIKRILADQDGSGDDVLYFRATRNMTVPVPSKVAYARNEEGTLERAGQMSPSGMSIFFAPTGYSAMQYMQAMDEMTATAEDEGVRELLRAAETVSLRFMMTTAAGIRVNALRDEGEANVYYRTVRDSWRKFRELTRSEIYYFIESKKLGGLIDIQSMSATDWNAYAGQAIEWLNANSDVDTNTWLALLVAQQSGMALDRSRTTAAAVDVNGDGEMDAARVTLPVPLSMIRGTSMTVSYEIFEDFPMTVGKIHGTPVTEAAMREYGDYQDMNYAVQGLYTDESCTFDMGVTLDRWYEILDGNGVGHMIALSSVDGTRANELKIPVRIQFDEADEEGDPETAAGYLIYRDGGFIGFLDAYDSSPLISLNNRKFDGAAAYPAAALELFPGFDILLPLYDDEGIRFSPERTENRGMRLVMTGLDEISALQDKPLQISAVATDIYGYDHAINDVIEAARAEAANGNILRSIEKAEITVPELTYNRRKQTPEFAVTVAGKELVRDQDYTVIGEDLFKAGTNRYVLVGTGDYVGTAEASCTLTRAESSVAAESGAALSDIAEADKVILTANTPAHPDNISFDFSGTGESLRQYLETGDDGRTVVLKKGAKAGKYVITVTVSGGAEDTYTDIEGESFTVEVK